MSKYYDLKKIVEARDKNFAIFRKENSVRSFIKERSRMAWIAFSFYDAEGHHYSCVSIPDFIDQYGKDKEHILDELLVIAHRSSSPSQDQGEIYYLWTVSYKEKDDGQRVESL